MINYITFEGMNIFKDGDYSDNYSVCGLCWRVGGELIGPCICSSVICLGFPRNITSISKSVKKVISLICNK